MNTTLIDSPFRPVCGIDAFNSSEIEALAKDGYFPRNRLFDRSFPDKFTAEIERLIAAGILKPAVDRIENGVPTEWILSLGEVWGHGPGSMPFRESPIMANFFHEMQQLAADYNRLRPLLISTGWVSAEEVPVLSTLGMELNINKVIGSLDAQWSGLHMHQDTHRFTPGLEALPEESIRHTAIRGRAFTVSGYARPLGPDGRRRNDAGGALPFLVRPKSRNPGDRAVFDIVPAFHNTGAFFFPHTTHGVGRMPATDSVRYSFQAFYPSAEVWSELLPRISAGELREELSPGKLHGV